MSNKSFKIGQKIRVFWDKYENKIVLFLGILLIAVVSFEIGVLEGNKMGQGSLIVESVSSGNPSEIKAGKGEVLGVEESKIDSGQLKETGDKECLFVGSKNSNKYHALGSQWANRIKPENRVCFKSKEEAESKGYVPSSSVK